MNNDHQLCCFLKLTRLMKREAQKKIAYSTGIDISLISRFEKGKRVPTDKQTQKLLAFYGTDPENFFREDENVENILNDLFEAIYYVKDYDLREQIILSLANQIDKTHYFPYYCLLCFCHYASKGKIKEASRYFWPLNKTIELYPYDQKVLFYSFCSIYYYTLKRIDKRELIFESVNQENITDVRIQALFHYYQIYISPNHSDMFEILTHYTECRSQLEKDHNHRRLMMLNIVIANAYSALNRIKESIEKDLETLTMLKEDDEPSWKYTIQHNLACSYLQLQDYEKVIAYLDKCRPYYDNRLTYFMYGFCYYKLGNQSLAEMYVRKALDTPMSVPYYDLLVEWLELMIAQPYQKKCIRVLEKIYTQYNDELNLETSQNILALMVDYYEHTQNAILAEQYKKMIQLDHLIVPIRK